jgi:hypothetical protein
MNGMRRTLILAVALTGMAAGASCGHAQSNRGSTPEDFSSGQKRVPGEYLVTLVPGADVEAITHLYGRFGIKGTKDIGHNIFLVTLTEDPGPGKMEELRAQDARIQAVQPNFVYRIEPSPRRAQ